MLGQAFLTAGLVVLLVEGRVLADLLGLTPSPWARLLAAGALLALLVGAYDELTTFLAHSSERVDGRGPRRR